MRKARILTFVGLVMTSMVVSGCSIPEILPIPIPEPADTSVHYTSITVSQSEATLAVGDTLQLSVTSFAPENADEGYTWSSRVSGIASVNDTGLVTAMSGGTTYIDVTGNKSRKTFASTKITVESVDEEGKTHLSSTYKDYGINNIYPLDYCPTIGKINLLIIPIWFTDSSTFISESKKENVREDIRTAYLGTNEETGWRSVKTFYEEESKGKIEIDGVVADWYEPRQKTDRYASETSGSQNTESLVKESTEAFFKNNSKYKKSDFDSDKNGYLDGVLLIYAAPDYLEWGKNSYSNLWAYCYWLQDETLQNTQNPGPNVFFWASYDFMYSKGPSARSKTGKSSYGGGNTSHCNVDSRTFVHEMGHVFGLDDYYDYGPNAYSPAAGFSMQDGNIGGHDPYSVMAFGWASPYIATDSAEFTIGAFEKTKDLILLTPSWNEYNSPFDEYLLFELFTPTGLNEVDCTYNYSSGSKGPSTVGIRLWHVDSRVVAVEKTKRSGQYEEPVYEDTNLTSNLEQGKYGVYQAFSNSSEADEYGTILDTEKYDDFNLLQLIRNDTEETYQTDSFLSSYDLFGNGTYSLTNYSKQFVNGTKFNKSSYSLDYTFTVEITGAGQDATAKVTITKN